MIFNLKKSELWVNETWSSTLKKRRLWMSCGCIMKREMWRPSNAGTVATSYRWTSEELFDFILLTFSLNRKTFIFYVDTVGEMSCDSFIFHSGNLKKWEKGKFLRISCEKDLWITDNFKNRVKENIVMT